MQGNPCLIEKKTYLRNNTDREILHVLIGTLKGRERVKRNIMRSVPRGRRDLPGHPFVAPGGRLRRSLLHGPSLITSPLLP